MTDQVIERIGFVVGRQPRLLDVALDQATTFQQLAHLCADPLDQPLQLVRAGPCHGAEHRRVGALEQIRPVVRLKAARIGGHQPRVLAFSREITECKEAEHALRASEEQYRTVFNASIDGLLIQDESHRIVGVNDAHLAMHGHGRDDMLGRLASEFIPEELQACCDALLPGVLGGPMH